jgi:hypothetical protein
MSPVCGRCVEVVGPLGSVRLLANDKCPSCKPGDIDIGEAAFGQIADKSVGRLAISWSFCDEGGFVAQSELPDDFQVTDSEFIGQEVEQSIFEAVEGIDIQEENEQ